LIVMDTHIWFWWVTANPKLSDQHVELIERAEGNRLIISAVSCWEIAYKAASGKLDLDQPAGEWMARSLARSGVHVEPVSSAIAVEAAILPGDVHKDPADRFIIATARILDCPLLSADAKVVGYNHVQHA
jgi:PIN domain nuclease of toxin-antitoxin system